MVSDETLALALREAHTADVSLFEALQRGDHIERDELLRADAAAAGLEWIEVTEQGWDTRLREQLPSQAVKTYRAIPMRLVKDDDGAETLTIAVERPWQLPARQTLVRLAATPDRSVIMVAGDPVKIARIIAARYGESLRSVDGRVGVGDPDRRTDLDAEARSDVAARRLYAQIFLDAHARRASDVHISPAKSGEGLEVRARIDSHLHVIQQVPEALRNG